MHGPRPLLLLLTIGLVSLPAQETVILEAQDGQKLSGAWYSPPGMAHGGAVLLHMYGANRETWRLLAPRLAASGFHVLALDLRGHGESRLGPDQKPVEIGRDVANDAATNPFLKMHRDAEAGLRFLMSKGAPKERLALIGASVGCSVALHCTSQKPELVGALVLMTPGTKYLGVPSLEHAAACTGRPILLLCAEDEAHLGIDPFKEIFPPNETDIRVVPGSLLHGTRMLGRVPAIEADILEWLQKALASRISLDIAMSKDVIVDGVLEETEGLAASWVTIPLEKEGMGRVRVSRNRSRLVIGFDVSERYLRQNEVIVYLDATGVGPDLPEEGCFRVSYSPKNKSRRPILVARGHAGTWKDTDDVGVMAYAMTSDSKRWTAELALPLARFVGKPTPCKLRLAFQINGQQASQQRHWPPTSNIQNAPRTWSPAFLAGDS